MNASSRPPDRDLPLHYDLLLPHADGARALLEAHGDSWALPRFTPAITDFRRVRHINEYVRAQYGIESVAQRCVAHRHDSERGVQYRVYALSNRGAAAQPSDGSRWVGADELDHVAFALPEQRPLIRQWLQEIGADRLPDNRPPWTAAGWFDEASAWIQSQLQQLDIQVLGPMAQERAWAISCVMRIETSIGDVYFKATPPFMAQEAVAMREVSRRYPDLLPPPLATDTERGWTLMPDFGGELLIHLPDVSRWEAALRQFARMQVEQVDEVDAWLARGIPDRRLSRMAELTDPLITMSAQILAGDPPGLTATEVEALRALPLKMKLLCANLASYGVPHTLVHGDLGGNILARGDQYVFFDWTDVCIAHPFFEMATMMDMVYDASRLPRHDATDARARLRDAYLEPWTAYESMARLVEAFELSKSLGALHQAMSYMWILMNVAADARWELESGLAMWLRRLLPAPS